MHESLRFYAIVFHHIVAVGRHLCCQIGRTLCAERPSLRPGRSLWVLVNSDEENPFGYFGRFPSRSFSYEVFSFL